MNGQTLVLDTGYRAVRRVSWQRAVTLWALGKVDLVEQYEDRHIRSVSLTMRMPSVVRYVKGDFYRKRSVRFSRENVYARDHGKCAYCAKTLSRRDATYDHVVPRAQGGRTRWENIVIACAFCNQRKDDRTPEQAGMKLLVRPHKPKVDPGLLRMAVTWDRNMPPSWKQFLVDAAYWHGELDSD